MNNLRPIGTIIEKSYTLYNNEMGECGLTQKFNECCYTDYFKIVAHDKDHLGRDIEVIKPIVYEV